jgi:hypothetical protein
MNQPAWPAVVGACVVLGAGLWGACSSPPSAGFGGLPSESEGGAGGSGGSSSSSSGGSSGSVGNPGNPSSSDGAAPSSTGSIPSAGADAATGGLPAGGGSGSGSLGPGGSSSSGGSTDAGHMTSSGGGDAGVALPPGCTLPATVSFKTDVQPFLAASCGNGGANGASGCHVIDASSTMAQGGFDHAYDWITGTAHASSCPELPTPFRFQVVIPVINQANPPSCSRSRIMPPSGAPLTACQVATLQSWLNEPMVTQTHRNDGISPTTPYAMPPFN